MNQSKAKKKRNPYPTAPMEGVEYAWAVIRPDGRIGFWPFVGALIFETKEECESMIEEHFKDRGYAPEEVQICSRVAESVQ